MRERDIEAYLVRRVEEAGGRAYKFTSPNRRNVPDRLVLWPGGHAEFVECKAPGNEPTAGQWREIDRLRALDFEVWVVDSIHAIELFIGGRRNRG